VNMDVKIIRTDICDMDSKLDRSKLFLHHFHDYFSDSDLNWTCKWLVSVFRIFSMSRMRFPMDITQLDTNA